MVKVSFDFDGTLSKLDIQKYASELVQNPKLEVWIVTRRYSESSEGNPDDPWWLHVGDANWKGVYSIAALVGVPKEHIHFCNMRPKADFFVKDNFLWHLDDDILEVFDISDTTDTVGILLDRQTEWKERCNELIEKAINGKENK